MVVDIPNDAQFATGKYVGAKIIEHMTYRPRVKPEQKPMSAPCSNDGAYRLISAAMGRIGNCN